MECRDQPLWSASSDLSRYVLMTVSPPFLDRLVILVVNASTSRAEDPGFESPLTTGFFSPGRFIPRTLKSIGTLVATLPGSWCYRVSAGTGRPGVSIL